MIKSYFVKSLAALTVLTSVSVTSISTVNQVEALQKYPDDRKLITNVTQTPYSGIVAMKGEDRQKPATGFIVGKNTVVTNKHVALRYQHTPEKLKIYALPEVSLVPAGGLYQAKKIIPYPGEEDLVVVHVSEHAIGIPGRTINMNTHTFEFNQPHESKVGDQVIATGFPADKEHGSMWRADGDIKRLNGSYFETFLYTAPGHSGSPIYNQNNKVVGILVGGTLDISEKFTTGVYFTKDIVQFIKENISRN